MEILIYGIKCEVHPKSPMIGDIVRCTNPKRYLIDSGGYRVEQLGIKGGFGQKFGTFAARGVKQGGLYHFDVDEYEKVDIPGLPIQS